MSAPDPELKRRSGEWVVVAFRVTDPDQDRATTVIDRALSARLQEVGFRTSHPPPHWAEPDHVIEVARGDVSLALVVVVVPSSEPPWWSTVTIEGLRGEADRALFRDLWSAVRLGMSGSSDVVEGVRTFGDWQALRDAASESAGSAAALRVHVVEGDLLEQRVDVIVNAWNMNVIPWWLLIPQGVSGAIKKRGGYAPFRELGYRPMPLGTARHTGAGRLPFKGIIHVATIDLLWRASATSIRDAVGNAAAMAVRHKYRSIAFPILGAGSGGFDEREAERIMLETLAEHRGHLRVVVVRFKPS